MRRGVPDWKRSIAAARAARAIVLAFLGLAAAAAGQGPIPPYMPLRAPMLAGLCATPNGTELAARRTGFCAGYVRAVLENDPRLQGCYPLLADVLEEVIARERRAPLIDDTILARDFVVEVAHELCGRMRR
jgi:hypothetical protein